MGRRDSRTSALALYKDFPPALFTRPLNPFVPPDLAPRLLWLPDQARNMGIHLQAGKGSGKSRLLGRVIAWQDFVRGIPQVILDPTGATIDNFLDKFLYLPKSYQECLGQRVLYCDMSGTHGAVTPFPLYYRLGNESLNDIAGRFLEVVQRLDPYLSEAPILGRNALDFIGRQAGMVLAAVGGQLTEMASLLDYPERWEGRLAQLVESCPEAREAAAFFLRYGHWKPASRQQLTGSLRVKLAPFVLDPTMRAMFGADRPGFTWQEVVAQGQTVLLDFRHELNPEHRRFKMLWAFRFFLEFIKTRGIGRHRPVSLLVDELAALYNYDAAAGHPIFAADLDELVNILARNYNVWLTVAHQEAWQVDEKSRQTLMSMGTQILGATTDFESALTLARDLLRVDPHRVKRWEYVWMSGFFSRPFVVDANPVEYTVQEQEYMHAYRFMNLGPFEFLVRPALAEGDFRGHLRRLSIADLDRGRWINDGLVRELRRRLRERDGRPIDRVLAEVEERPRLLTAPSPPQQPDALPASRDTLAPHEKPPARVSPTARRREEDDDAARFRRKATP
jgi:hypothetical protein